AGQVAGLTERGEKPSRLPLRSCCGEEREVLAHSLLGCFVERHKALLVALAENSEHVGVALGGRNWQRNELGHPQSRGVEHFDQASEPRGAKLRQRGLVSLVDVDARLRQQPVYLGGAEYLGQRTAAFRPFDDGGWVVATAPLCIEEAIELADGREPPRHRRGRE